MTTGPEGTVDPIELLRQLWEGDELTYGYQHSSIVVELLRHTETYMDPTAQWVANHLRANRPRIGELDQEEQDIIDFGIRRWKDMGSPRRVENEVEKEKELSPGAARRRGLLGR